MFGPVTAASSANEAGLYAARPACSSRQMRTSGAISAARRLSSRQNGATSCSNCHAKSASSSATFDHDGPDADRARAARAGAAAHRHDAVDAEAVGQLQRAEQARLGVGAGQRVGVQDVARGVHARQPQAVLGEVALEAVALAALLQQAVEVEVRPRLRAPRADAHLDVLDPPLRAPGEHAAAIELGQGIRVQADAHRHPSIDLRNADTSSATSARASSAVVRTGAPSQMAAWNPRSSLRNASS